MLAALLNLLLQALRLTATPEVIRFWQALRLSAVAAVEPELGPRLEKTMAVLAVVETLAAQTSVRAPQIKATAAAQAAMLVVLPTMAAVVAAQELLAGTLLPAPKAATVAVGCPLALREARLPEAAVVAAARTLARILAAVAELEVVELAVLTPMA